MKPTILFFSSAETWRGGEVQLLELIKIIRDEIDLFVLCPFSSELYNRCTSNKVQVIGYKKTISIDIFAAYKLMRVCSIKKVDIIHNNDSGSQTITYLSGILFKNKTLSVLSKRTIFPFSKGRVSTLKYSHKNLKKIICVSKAARDVVYKGYEKRENVKVIYDGITIKKNSSKKTTLKEEFNLDKNSRLIGFVGGLSEEKGIPYLIEAFSKVKDKINNVVLIIVGDGVLKNELKEMVFKANLEKNVVFTGFRNDIISLMRNFDVFVLSSLSEGYPTVILEAFVSKVPVVASCVGGVVEIINDKKNGFLCKPKNHYDLYTKILEVLENKEVSEKMIKAAYSDVVTKHSMNTTSKKVIELYLEVIKENHLQ